MNTIDWTIPNLITVTLMVILTFAVFGFLWRIMASFAGGKSPAPGAPVAGETGDLS